MNLKVESVKEWESINTYAETRHQELSKIFEPLIEAINAYEKLACRLVLALGRVHSFDSKDDAWLDLFAEAFDALHNSKRLILEWLPSSDFALLRRAYEITSLFAYFVLNPSKIEDWEKGKQFNNKEIRDFLANHPMGEQGTHLKEFYSILSKGTHVNREFVPYRQLGRGNQFTLGSISRPVLTVVAQHLFWLISIWFWLMALAGYHYKETLQIVDSDFGSNYMAVAEQAQETVKTVEGQWDELTDFDFPNDET